QPGVYQFFDQTKKLIYIGKAANLKSRVGSYFSLGKNAHSRPIEQLIEKVATIETRRTDTVLEAYFLEQDLIKKHQPKYNVLGKDDKSASFLVVTREKFPRFLIKRQTDLYEIGPAATENKSLVLKKSAKKLYRKIYGPYASKHSLATALKILRKIFPFHNRPQKSEEGCLSFQLGLCPGPYAGRISVSDYRKNIRAIETFIRGGKKKLLKKLEQEMKQTAQAQDFEKAAEKRNQLFALEHIQDIALIKNSTPPVSAEEKSVRLEAYDISHISGQKTVGSMVVFSGPLENLKPDKAQYRKFKIKTATAGDDILAMKEVLTRRFRNDWPQPDLVILDGGKGQLNMAQKLFTEMNIDVPLLAVAKGPTRKKLDLYSTGKTPSIKPEFLAQM
ncbi:MAG: hypothetical protein CSA81_14880, partial [Acidobacteria bacterium]